MQLFSFSYILRLMPLLGCSGLLGLFIHLGLWQSGKAERTAAQAALFEDRSNNPPLHIGTALVVPAMLAYARVSVRGEYEPEKQFYIDNQVNNGQPGVHVITPLKIDSGETRVLVNRGWAPWPDRRIPPRIKIPGGKVELTGIAVIPVATKYLLMPEHREAWRELWPNLDMKRYAGENAYPVQPVVIYLSTPDKSDGLVRIEPQPEDKTMMHKGYALQWFGMAAALVLFCFVAWYRKLRMKKSGNPAGERSGIDE